jgi:hypothetical protein
MTNPPEFGKETTSEEITGSFADKIHGKTSKSPSSTTSSIAMA